MTEDDTEPELAAIERAMVRIRRSQTRRSLAKTQVAAAERPADLTVLGVVDAVEQGPPEPGGEVTVGMVGDRLGIDPSRASRVVAAAITSGTVRRVASQDDGRRIGLELTDRGRDLAREAHETRRALYDRLMRDWPERDRTEFARLLTAFTTDLATATPTR